MTIDTAGRMIPDFSWPPDPIRHSAPDPCRDHYPVPPNMLWCGGFCPRCGGGYLGPTVTITYTNYDTQPIEKLPPALRPEEV